MKTLGKFWAGAVALVLAFALAGCGSSSAGSGSGSGSGEGSGDSGPWPVKIEHAFGTTTIKEKPERVATIDYANQDVPLALGIVPLGMKKETWGDANGDGMQKWVADRLKELDAEKPVLFDETDGYDFEAVSKTKPDIILAAYSGMTKEDYETLSKIAPVVAYPEHKWGTPWRETIRMTSKALGQEQEGKDLIKTLEKDISDAVAKHPNLKGTNGMFMTHVDPTDLSEVNFYSAHDTRSKFLEDLGMKIAPSIVEASGDEGEFAGSISVERADELKDVDVIVTYGGDKLIKALEDDPVLSTLPAVKNDAIVNLDGKKPVGAAANPTALSIPATIDQYTKMLSEAAEYTKK